VIRALWWENLEAKRTLGRPRPRWENIKINLQKVGWVEYELDCSGSG
jgi:hypothetical protein